MSEYQFVYFAAVDRPLDDEELEFMERQSSRAEVSRWEFTNEYHYGDFRGDALEMLRRGFDVHLHYANYGLRRLMFRLPNGLPWSKKVFSDYHQRYQIEWKPDKGASAGTLCIEPEADAGTYCADFLDMDPLCKALPKIREWLIRGDLRPLYLAWIACTWDEEAIEPPVPGGLADLPAELEELCGIYEIPSDFVAAAAESSPAAADVQDEKAMLRQWLDRRSEDELRQLVLGLLGENPQAFRAVTLSRIRLESATPAWPTNVAGRTLKELEAAAERQRIEREHTEESQREKARKKRLAAIAADPEQTIAQVRQLAGSRSTAKYKQAAELLADLREALGPRGDEQALKIATKLVRDHPTIHRLKAALRKQELLPRGATR